MKKIKNKILLILSFIGIFIVTFGTQLVVEAANSLIYVSPSQLTKNTGEIFNITVRVNPNGQKVCAVEGKLNLNNLSCQKVTVESDIISQTPPSCDNLYFLLGIPQCTMNDRTLFVVTVKAGNVGSASVSFTNVDIIGEGVSISSASSGGNYTIISPCTCSAWSSWENKACGGGNCSPTQRLQIRTRTCTPSGCNVEVEYRCLEDLSCIPRPPATPTEGEIKEKEIREQPPTETLEKPQEIFEETQKKETKIPKKITFPEERTPQKGLLASLGMVVREIKSSVLLTIVTFLCLVGLVTIGAREWWLFRKKRKK